VLLERRMIFGRWRRLVGEFLKCLVRRGFQALTSTTVCCPALGTWRLLDWFTATRAAQCTCLLTSQDYSCTPGTTLMGFPENLGPTIRSIRVSLWRRRTTQMPYTMSVAALLLSSSSSSSLMQWTGYFGNLQRLLALERSYKMFSLMDAQNYR